MDASLLNIASFGLGLLAWIIPVLGMLLKVRSQRVGWFILASLTASGLALLFQIFYGNHLVKIEDWSALADTQGAVALVSAVNLLVTILLNNLLLAASWRKAVNPTNPSIANDRAE